MGKEDVLEYHAPHFSVILKLNSLLGLKTDEQDQDWEIVCAATKLIPEILALFKEQKLNLEEESALGLLLIFSLERWVQEGEVAEVNIRELEDLFRTRPELSARMRFFFLRRYFQDPEEARVLQLVYNILKTNK